MTDIVERLRTAGLRSGFAIILKEHTDEAADEIERLQAHKRAQAEDIMTLGQQVGQLETAIAELEVENADQRAEIERLKRELEKANTPTWDPHL